MRWRVNVFLVNCDFPDSLVPNPKPYDRAGCYGRSNPVLGGGGEGYANRAPLQSWRQRTEEPLLLSLAYSYTYT
jgi:hypothetical protein